MTMFLLDEHLPKWWRQAIRRLQPQLQLRCLGDLDAPAFGSLDPVILEWCEANDAYLVTNNRSTMSSHLAEHVAKGRHVAGIFMLVPRLGIDELASQLALIEGAAMVDEYKDQVTYLPVT